jgi:hypothetical protein
MRGIRRGAVGAVVCGVVLAAAARPADACEWGGGGPLTGTLPADGAAGVPVDVEVRVFFAEGHAPGSAETVEILTGGTVVAEGQGTSSCGPWGEPVPCDIRFRPAAPLAPMTAHVLRLRHGSLDGSYSVRLLARFTTSGHVAALPSPPPAPIGRMAWALPPLPPVSDCDLSGRSSWSFVYAFDVLHDVAAARVTPFLKYYLDEGDGVEPRYSAEVPVGAGSASTEVHVTTYERRRVCVRIAWVNLAGNEGERSAPGCLDPPPAASPSPSPTSAPSTASTDDGPDHGCAATPPAPLAALVPPLLLLARRCRRRLKPQA